MAWMANVNEAARLMAQRSVEARIRKWGKREFIRRMREGQWQEEEVNYDLQTCGVCKRRQLQSKRSQGSMQQVRRALHRGDLLVQIYVEGEVNPRIN